jgi:uncharacterized phiE125 gp8 family phage protein
MPAYQLTAPAAEPVSVADAKTAARLTGSHWDGIVAASIATARAVAEHETGRRLVSQVWRHELTDWPASTDLLPEHAPTAVAIAYWNGSTWATLAGESYVWSPMGPGRAFIALAPVLDGSWPALGTVALGPRVRVDVTSGAADAAAAAAAYPEACTFIKALVAVMVQDPTLTAGEHLAQHKYLRHVLDPLRLYR